MITITISGGPGSGKTTIAQLLEKQLKIPYVYAGALFREMANKYNMSLEEFGRYCEAHPDIDQQLDEYQIQVLRKGNVILEGRIAGWLAYQNKIPATKILIHADLTTRTQRIVKREQGAIEKRKKEIQIREKSEKKRYMTYYNIDVDDRSIYDIIIDSSKMSPEEILKVILTKL
jgi:cytidylate kinase